MTTGCVGDAASHPFRANTAGRDPVQLDVHTLAVSDSTWLGALRGWQTPGFHVANEVSRLQLKRILSCGITPQASKFRKLTDIKNPCVFVAQAFSTSGELA